MNVLLIVSMSPLHLPARPVRAFPLNAGERHFRIHCNLFVLSDPQFRKTNSNFICISRMSLLSVSYALKFSCRQISPERMPIRVANGRELRLAIDLAYSYGAIQMQDYFACNS